MVTNPAIHVRAAAASDAERIDVLVGSLSPESIVRRFMGGVSRATAAEELRREIRGDGAEFALIAEDASGEIVGEAYAAILSPGDAEAAFVVRDCAQHHGVGTALLSGIVAELRARKVRMLHADTSSGNVAMLALLHKGGFAMRERYLNGSVQVTLQLEP